MAIDRYLALRGTVGRAWPQDRRPTGSAGEQWPSVSATAIAAEVETAVPLDRLPFGRSTTAAITPRIVAAGYVPRRPVSTPTLESPFAPLAAQVRRLLDDHAIPFRLAGHVSVLVVAAIVLVISQIGLPTWEVSIRLLPSSVGSAGSVGSSHAGSSVAAFANGSSVVPLTGHDSLQRSAIPFTIAQEEPVQEIEYYAVQPGDTVLGIAAKFGIRPETIIWSNAGLEQHVEMIRPGDQLAILPVDGAYHTVVAGDTLSSLADKYDVSMESIVAYSANQLTDVTAPLSAGDKLVIPGGSRPFTQQYAVAYDGPIPATAKIGSGSFVWPTSGPITQAYWGAHRGIDIGGWTGAPVKAADSGYVTLAATGWNTGYGNYVIVDHGNSFSTLYSHLNSVYVRAGESVSRGQDIGSVGNTGNTTGPHLHLEILYNGVSYNPMGYLP